MHEAMAKISRMEKLRKFLASREAEMIRLGLESMEELERLEEYEKLEKDRAQASSSESADFSSGHAGATSPLVFSEEDAAFWVSLGVAGGIDPQEASSA